MYPHCQACRICSGAHTRPPPPPPPTPQVEKAPRESYADVGGLEPQIQEIKEAVELPLTHPELYEDIGIKPPKVCVGGVQGGRWLCPLVMPGVCLYGLP